MALETALATICFWSDWYVHTTSTSTFWQKGFNTDAAPASKSVGWCENYNLNYQLKTCMNGPRKECVQERRGWEGEATMHNPWNLGLGLFLFFLSQETTKDQDWTFFRVEHDIASIQIIWAYFPALIISHIQIRWMAWCINTKEVMIQFL